jgi:hypothetical protein
MTELFAQDALWIPEGEGKWSRPLGFLPDRSGWVELMRLDPGVRLGLHRHTGLTTSGTATTTASSPASCSRPPSRPEEPVNESAMPARASQRRPLFVANARRKHRYDSHLRLDRTPLGDPLEHVGFIHRS